MRGSLRSAFLVAMCAGGTVSVATAQSTVVVPNAAAAATGGGAIFDTLTREFGRSFQQVISTTELGSMPAGSIITGVTFRSANAAGNPLGTWPPADLNWADYEVYLGQAATAPGSMSTNYATNVVAGSEVQVRDGALTIPAASFSNSVALPGANPWGHLITITPWNYPGGDLVITIRHSGHATAGTPRHWVDCVTNPAAPPAATQCMANSTMVALDGTATQSNPAVFRFTFTPPGANGACCNGDGTCTDNSAPGACLAAGGTFMGSASTCAASNCQGACCKNDGSCSFGGTAACAAAGDVFQGLGTACATANCPQPGACCINTGATGCIADLLPAACAAQGGTYGGAGSTCASANCSIPCPAITGSFTGLGTGTSSDPTATFATQTNRLFRDGAPDTCALSASGGAPIAGTFTFVKHDFTNNSPNPQCVTFSGAINCPTNQLYPAAYIGAFDPNNILLNNVASTGSSAAAGSLSMSFTVPGNTAFSIVMAEVTSGGTCASYSFQLNGANLSCTPTPPPGCYANCDNSTSTPVLNVADFTCFLTKFAGGNASNVNDPANCDGSTTIPVLNVADFTCFLTKFAGGCP